jgi:NitT/TauT family transport system permease protein
MRFKTLELPFASIGLIWNSIMSWAGGWFFLMAAEIFTVGERDFRLPGLGAFLQQAASQGDLAAVAWGIGTLVLVIVVFDQFLWRPLLAWADRFKLEMVESDNPPTAWFYDQLRNSRVANWFLDRLWRPSNERLDRALLRRFPPTDTSPQPATSRPWLTYIVTGLVVVGLAYGVYQAAAMLVSVPLDQWAGIGIGLVATLLHVVAALVIALAWTVVVGVLIGTNQRMATILQPVVQILASVPATALFPVVLLFLLPLPGGLDIAAVLLMLMGTQWYLLFNVIAGATAIPQDMKYTTTLLQLSRWERWRTLILPALFPYLITGAITASGGAWNASIVAEHVEFGGETLSTTGIGATIAQATSAGNYPLLLAATFSMMLTVVLINRFVWRRLYRLAEEKYRME